MKHGGDFAAAAKAKTAEGSGALGRHAKEHGCSVQEAARALAPARGRCARRLPDVPGARGQVVPDIPGGRGVVLPDVGAAS